MIERYLKDDDKVKSLIISALDNKHAKIVLRFKSSKEMWEKLCATHEQRSSANRIALQSEFFELRMKNDESVADYIARAEYVQGKLLDIDVKIDDETLIGKVISGLPRRYMNFVTTWGNLDPKNHTIIELHARLTAEETMHNSYRTKQVENAMFSDGRGRGRGFRNKGRGAYRGGRGARGGRGGRDSRYNEDRNYMDKSSPGDTTEIKRWKCGQVGHLKKECKQKGAVADESKREESYQGGEENAIIVEEALSAGDLDDWIVDTGASCHMTYDKSEFVTYRDVNTTRKVKFGNDSYGYGIGIGDIELVTTHNHHRNILRIKDVLYIPTLRRKLISVSAATKLGCRAEFNTSQATLISRNGTVIMVANKRDGLYVAEVESCSARTYAAIEDDELTLWHERFGHINKASLVKTSKQVNGMGDLKKPKGDKNN